MIKHKHEREIVAWANGADIEYRIGDDKWSPIEAPNWIPSASYRVKPDCEYAFEVMKEHGILDIYEHWLNGEEVTAEHPACKSSLLKASDHEDPFHYFLECAKGHKLSKKVVKIKKWLWIQVMDDKLVDHCYLIESDVDNISDLLGYTGWIKTEHFIEVEK